MKKLCSVLRGALPHATLILALMMLVFFVIDRFNDAMAFLNNDLTKWLLFAFCLLAAILSLVVIAADEKARKEKPKGEKE